MYDFEVKSFFDRSDILFLMKLTPAYILVDFLSDMLCVMLLAGQILLEKLS